MTRLSNTSSNSVFAVRFAHPNAFGTSQTRRPLKEGVSLSLVARDLIKEALELHEDIYWQQVAREREKTFSYKKSLSHKKIWK